MLAEKAANMHAAIVDVQNKRPVTDILIMKENYFAVVMLVYLTVISEAKFIIINS